MAKYKKTKFLDLTPKPVAPDPENKWSNPESTPMQDVDAMVESLIEEHMAVTGSPPETLPPDIIPMDPPETSQERVARVQRALADHRRMKARKAAKKEILTERFDAAIKASK